jgi:hypothetical protein
MQRHVLEVLSMELAVCRLGPHEPLPDWALGADFFNVTRTANELSIICPQDRVPPGVEMVGGWQCLKVRGPLDFNQVGVLASLARPLAAAKISVMAVSTFETDYILLREKDIKLAVSALRKDDHLVQYQ